MTSDAVGEQRVEGAEHYTQHADSESVECLQYCLRVVMELVDRAQAPTPTEPPPEIGPVRWQPEPAPSQGEKERKNG